MSVHSPEIANLGLPPIDQVGFVVHDLDAEAQMVHALAALVREFGMGALTATPLDEFDLERATAAEGDIELDVGDASPEVTALHRAVDPVKWPEQGGVAGDGRVEVVHDKAHLVDGRKAEICYFRGMD